MLDIQRKDNIIAIASAAGAGAIACIRLSGADVISMVDNVFFSENKAKTSLADSKSHRLHYGTLKDGETIIDEVLVSVFRNPHSFTGEDIIEISCHGSIYIQQKILEYFLMHGARLAQPGEFTLRAFLNGKMDLSQAEAVADLIAADSASSHRLAMNQLRGGFSNEIAQLREELIHFASMIELELDFAEEDVEFASRNDLLKTVDHLRKLIKNLIDSFEVGNVLKNGIPVVIAGEPNVGKSTLLNALLNEDRAIVSEIAGTTRDTIEEEIVLGGVKFRFIDTAGIRDTSDTIERIGVEKTYEKMRQSPVIIFLFDINEMTGTALENKLEELKSKLSPGFRIIPVANKIDGKDLAILQNEFKNIPSVIFISAKQKINLFAITETLIEQVKTGALEGKDIVVTNARHADALRKTSDALERVQEGLNNKVTNDFIAGDLKHALYYLGEITGQISSDDLLANIFSKFCIGK
ncbi:MAG TPA: tRNA uridine-5-carboxymethylaminomethyl(34) synthesis GTPase MnmE [Bacteroidia bacterium]|nr:tRNA uridine-5-carboxymethylaminomethyl(34) synthesis GTPase MnmE [Bacteroidia bacterium]HNS12578.1 tRNA uridine-5-carboxymethylaminomethyl(34) synthesis GTPase MnmE [Bacteroidia bacterium]